MGSEHVEELRLLRHTMVAQRRQVVRDLANPQEPGGAQDLREMLAKVQATIDVIDRALTDDEISLVHEDGPVQPEETNNDEATDTATGERL